MSRPKRDPYILPKLPNRSNYYAYFSREEKNVSLGTANYEEACRKFAEMLQSRRLHKTAEEEKPIAQYFADCYSNAQVNNTEKTAYEIHLNLRRVLGWLEGENIIYPSEITLEVVEAYKKWRQNGELKPWHGKVSVADKLNAERPDLDKSSVEYKKEYDRQHSRELYRRKHGIKRQRKDGNPGVGNAKINRELDAWSRALKLILSTQISSIFKKMKESKPIPHDRGLTKPDITKFFSALVNSKYARYECLFRVVLGTAMRDEEMRHMDKSDIREETIVVTPKPGWTTKNYRYRELKVSEITINHARKFLDTKNFLRMDKKYIWEIIQDMCRQANVKPFSLHDLRRAMASHMYKDGMSISRISKYLGHADKQTTERYIRHVEDEISRNMLPF